jgi:hypothetical protein
MALQNLRLAGRNLHLEGYASGQGRVSGNTGKIGDAAVYASADIFCMKPVN